jgi:hypothetical protein
MTWHIVSMQKLISVAQHFGRILLPMLVLSSVVALCGMPSAHSFTLSCADQGSKLDQPYEDGDPIELAGNFTCAPLTSPRALDIIVAYQPEFLSPLLNRVYFYAYNHRYDAKDNNSGPMYEIIGLPKSLAKGDNDLYRYVKSTQEYVGEVLSDNCVIRDFLSFRAIVRKLEDCAHCHTKRLRPSFQGWPAGNANKDDSISSQEG